MCSTSGMSFSSIANTIVLQTIHNICDMALKSSMEYSNPHFIWNAIWEKLMSNIVQRSFIQKSNYIPIRHHINICKWKMKFVSIICNSRTYFVMHYICVPSADGIKCAALLQPCRFRFDIVRNHVYINIQLYSYNTNKWLILLSIFNFRQWPRLDTCSIQRERERA